MLDSHLSVISLYIFIKEYILLTEWLFSRAFWSVDNILTFHITLFNRVSKYDYKKLGKFPIHGLINKDCPLSNRSIYTSVYKIHLVTKTLSHTRYCVYLQHVEKIFCQNLYC